MYLKRNIQTFERNWLELVQLFTIDNKRAQLVDSCDFEMYSIYNSSVSLQQNTSMMNLLHDAMVSQNLPLVQQNQTEETNAEAVSMLTHLFRSNWFDTIMSAMIPQSLHLVQHNQAIPLTNSEEMNDEVSWITRMFGRNWFDGIYPNISNAEVIKCSSGITLAENDSEIPELYDEEDERNESANSSGYDPDSSSDEVRTWNFWYSFFCVHFYKFILFLLGK